MNTSHIKCLQGVFKTYTVAQEQANNFCKDYLTNKEFVVLYNKICPTPPLDSSQPLMESDRSKKLTDVLKFAKSPDHFLRNVTTTSLQRFLKDKEVDTVALKGVLERSSDWADIILLVWKGRFANVKVGVLLIQTDNVLSRSA